MTVGCIIQARMGSERLPGKVLMNLDNENPALYYSIKQLESAKSLDKIIVATTDLPEDDIIVEYVKKLGIDYFRGSSENVLDRYYQCAKKYSFTTVVRIPADKPLIDPEIVDNVIEHYNSNSYDYVSNFLVLTYPSGSEVEVFSFDALEKVWKGATSSYDKEHVTPYLYNNETKFKIHNLKLDENLSHLRWALDWPEDLELIRIIISKIKKRPILLKDILELMSKEPELQKINKK